jgi:hypothetical protein
LHLSHRFWRPRPYILPITTRPYVGQSQRTE